VTLLAGKVAVARTAGALARLSGRGGGTSLPGKVLLRLEPHAIAELSGRLPEGSAVISATNGKTTTAAMVAAILGEQGRRLVHNRSGANMAGGVAATLLTAAGHGRAIRGELGLFEVDEFWLPGLVRELAPRALVLGNLFRDQLDRYGELETIAGRWADVVASLPPECALVLNADDPVIADLGRGRPNVTYFGIEDPAVALPQMQHAADSKHCRNCGAPYRYDQVYLGHLGNYHCESCGQRRPQPALAAREIVLHGTDSAELTLQAGSDEVRVKLPLPGLYNVYNALAAAALTLRLGVTLPQIQAALASVHAAFGRAESVTVDGVQLRLLLIKNPAGANEVLRTLALHGGELQLLGVLNDRIADGRDVSWVWDADFELLAPHVATMVCAGTRAAELALRMKYAGVDPARLEVVPELPAALDRALGHAPNGQLHVLPTYTAMLALRDELGRRAGVDHYWRERT
jgi:UDP-N-acetylmuramyl tripeptide synthase